MPFIHVLSCLGADDHKDLAAAGPTADGVGSKRTKFSLLPK